MPGKILRTAFLTPIDPTTPGNGLAHRARSWQQALGRIGTVSTVLVPTHGRASAGDHSLVHLAEPACADRRLPERSARAPEALGRAWAGTQAPVDVVVGLRADLGPFALGAAAVMEAPVMVDLDDDDDAYHRSRGDDETADRYRELVGRLRERAHVLTSVTGFGSTVAVPNAVTVPEPPSGRSVPRPPSVQLLMVGNFGYPPNLEGWQWFADEVLPLVREQRPDAVLVAAGPGSEALEGGLGYVADLGPLYAAAAVAIVAVCHGSGSRIKALEAFAHGVPVVGTTVGLDGIDAVHGRECLLADTAAALADQVVRILSDPRLARSLATSAQGLVRRRYEAETVERAMAALVADLVRSTPTSTWWRADRLDVTETTTGLRVIDTATGTLHELNASAAVVFTLADGSRSEAAMARAFAELFAIDESVASVAVESAALDLVRAGLLVPRPTTVRDRPVAQPGTAARGPSEERRSAPAELRT